MIRSILAAAAFGAVIWTAWTWHHDRLSAAVAHAKALAQAQTEAAGEWERTATSATLALADCQDRWQDAQRTADELLAAQARADADRRAKSAAWQARWDARSQSCGAALLDMQRACEREIGSY